MPIYNYAKCDTCDYEQEYNPTNYKYIYPRIYGLEDLPYPEIRHAWCINCKTFVPIQKGININDIKNTISIENKKLERLNRKIFKFNKDKQDAQSLINKINLYVKFKELIKCSTVDSCIECGSTNLIYKDIIKDFWVCPKCNKGILKIHRKKYDIYFRLADKEINPVGIQYEPFVKKDYGWNRFDKMLLCANEILKTDCLFLVSENNLNTFKILNNNIAWAIIDRASLVYTLLEYDKTYDYRFISRIKTPLVEYFKLSWNDRLESEDRIRKMISYFRQELSFKTFLPNGIIYTLLNPAEEPVIDISKTDIKRSLTYWRIVQNKTKAYFSFYKDKTIL